MNHSVHFAFSPWLRLTRNVAKSGYKIDNTVNQYFRLQKLVEIFPVAAGSRHVAGNLCLGAGPNIKSRGLADSIFTITNVKPQQSGASAVQSSPHN